MTCYIDYYGKPCALPRGHATLVDGWDAHRAADGFLWAHHEEEIGADMIEIWEEPLGADGEPL